MVAAWGGTYDETNFLQLHNLNETKEVQAQVPKCHLDFVFVWAQVGWYGIFLDGVFSCLVVSAISLVETIVHDTCLIYYILIWGFSQMTRGWIFAPNRDVKLYTLHLTGGFSHPMSLWDHHFG